MAHLAPYYDPDIFVSYSHGKSGADGKSPLKEWTHALIRELENTILALHTEFDELKIWKDDQIDPTLELTKELRAKVSASGVLMIVMSNRYLASSWCHDELEWFRAQIEDRAGEAGRVFVVRAQTTDPNGWPDFLRDERGYPLIGFTFHDQETGMPWGWPDLREMPDEFRKELWRLHTALTRRLRELRQRADLRSRTEAAPQPDAIPKGSRPIYLHSSPESDTVRSDIERALSSDGIRTLAAQHCVAGNLKAMQLESKLRIEAAKRCDALALVRVDDGERFVGDLFEIGVDERERIAKERRAPMPCAVLDKTGETLPVDVSAFGIERFDINRGSWRGEFRQWLNTARARSLDLLL